MNSTETKLHYSNVILSNITTTMQWVEMDSTIWCSPFQWWCSDSQLPCHYLKLSWNESLKWHPAHGKINALRWKWNDKKSPYTKQTAWLNYMKIPFLTKKTLYYMNSTNTLLTFLWKWHNFSSSNKWYMVENTILKLMSGTCEQQFCWCIKSFIQNFSTSSYQYSPKWKR